MTHSTLTLRGGDIKTNKCTIGLLILLITVNVTAQDRMSTSGSKLSATPATLRARRGRVMQAAPDALVLVRSRTKIMAENEDGFRQDATFYYLTGLDNALGALLVLDSRRRESWLFVAAHGQLPRIGSLMRPPYAYVEVGEASAARLGFDRIVAWDEFGRFVDRRLAEDPSLVIRGPFSKDNEVTTPALLVGKASSPASFVRVDFWETGRRGCLRSPEELGWFLCRHALKGNLEVYLLSNTG